jgi:hypothetical protein
VKNLKFGVLLFGALGLVSLFMLKIIPDGFKHDAVNAILVLAGFAAPVAMGVMGISKPFARWMGAVATAGFALVLVKFRVYEMIKHIGDVPTEFKLLIISTVLGLVVSIITLAKPEEG